MKIAICFSGHLRNIAEHITNLKNNLLDIISEEHQYDIYIHTWDDNKTNNTIRNNDHFFKKKTYTLNDTLSLFNSNGINIKDILIENQEETSTLLNIESWLTTLEKGNSIHGKFDTTYVRGILTMLFWQFYGYMAVFNIIKNIDEYNYIIKTRPDMLYDTFDIKYLDMPLFFPLSHQNNNTNINSLFFGGRTEYMKDIMSYFNNIIYKNGIADMNLIRQYDTSDINFNNIFRYYIINYLQFDPIFCKYDPKIYRTANTIIKLSS